MALQVKDWDQLYENNRTRKLKRMDWVPVPNRHDGDGYTELVDSPNGAARLGAWLAILQVASRCDPRGTLVRESGRTVPHGCASMAHTAESLARITRLPVAAFEDAIPKLIEIGWLTECNETISQETAGIPHDDAPSSSLSGTAVRANDYGREWNGTEGNGNTSSPAGPDEGLVLRLEPRAEKTPSLGQQQERWFHELFWPEYWRKVDKADALKAWKKHATTETKAAMIVEAVKAHAPTDLKREPEHRPHASTWLNKLRYEEPPEQLGSGVTDTDAGIALFLKRKAEDEAA
jgi:hypothetical protein